MNSVEEIERQLRAAPRPTPPAGLRDQLVAQIQVPASETTSFRRVSFGGRWRRWWPALAGGAVTAACAAVLTLQHLEMQDIRESLKALGYHGGVPEQVQVAPLAFPPGPSVSKPAALNSNPEEEMARLRETAGQLRSEIARLEQAQVENKNLREQLAAPQSGMLTAEEKEALTRARERAQAITCVNNLKQIGLAARVYAQDNQDSFPPDFLSMSNELATPKILVCAADTNRQVAVNWSSYSLANCSYEFLAPGGSFKEPFQILSRCPIHGNIGLCDGSVMMGVAKEHPDAVVQQDGKWYYRPALTK